MAQSNQLQQLKLDEIHAIGSEILVIATRRTGRISIS